MKMTSIFLPPILAASLLSAEVALAAGNDVDMTPPPTVNENAPATQDTPQPEESAPNLGTELKGSTPDQNVQIYSYKRKDGATVQEYSVHGKVYMVKIQPAGGLPPYYLYDNNGDGNFTQHPGRSLRHLSPPVWVIKRF